jgi:hypothetical protein
MGVIIRISAPDKDAESIGAMPEWHRMAEYSDADRASVSRSRHPPKCLPMS